MNKLDQLKSMTTVVADTGDLASIAKFNPVDATTNPTLLLKAAQTPDGQALLREIISWAKQSNIAADDFLQACTEKFTIDIGKKISQLVPGRVSTEVDARLSFDRDAMVTKAEQLIAMYAEAGVASDRILIKLAATWEGIKAAEILEQRNIQCNLTLIFSFSQAVACANANAHLISPFVGRIYDWYQKRSPEQPILPEQDPGVLSVRNIYHYYKQHGFKTIVMGASFRTTGQIEALAGCDNLTVSPGLLQQLENDTAVLEQKLSQASATAELEKIEMNEVQFRWALNENPMATEKLAEGIRSFAVNQVDLEQLIQDLSA